jgi:hypothetical protein
MGTIHKFERSKPAKAAKPGPWDQAAAKPSAPPKVPMFKASGSGRGGREPIINSWRGLVMVVVLMLGLSLITGMAGNLVAQVMALFH